MQVQDYLPFFQDLALHYYQFTLENSVYAACLAIAVWLLTSIFYSVRIGFLNRRNRITQRTTLETQSALAAAKQEMQGLQEEIVAGKAEIEQEVQRVAVLHERLAALAAQLSESIVALAADPELGQQGLSVSDGLEAEHLWQRYSAAVKHIGETLVAERKALRDLQQVYSEETAKLAEKEGQLQAMQTRLDSQRQQLAKLELTVDEQKKQLTEQQESAQQSLARIEAKHQIDLARLVSLEQQAQERAQIKTQQEKPKAPVASIAEPVQVKPVEIREIPAQVVSVEPEPKQAYVEPRPSVSEMPTPEPTIARAETAKHEQETKASKEAAGGVTGKFKSLFAGAKQQMEKLDDMFGLNTPMLEPKESSETSHPVREPKAVVVETPIIAPEVSSPEPQPKIEDKAPAAGLGGKFKNLFGSSKAASVAAAAVAEEMPLEAVSAEPAPAPVAEVADLESSREPGKLKSLFGKLKRTS